MGPDFSGGQVQMFGQLSASRPTRSFRTGEWAGLIGASALHIGVVLIGTGQVDALPRPLLSDKPPIVFPGPREPVPPGPEQGGPDGLVIPENLPMVDWPSGAIPDLDLTAEPVEVDLGWDPADLIGRPSGLPLPSGNSLRVPAGGGGGSVREEVLDLPLRLVRAPEPRYPEWLRKAGITGVATVEFVVDTLGRVETGSIEVIQTTREEFGEAVIRALENARFSPGTVRGSPVRVKVRQVFRFQIRP